MGMGQFDPIQAPMPEPIGNPDPMTGGDLNAAGSDPNAGMDPMAGGDPNADPNAMGDDPMAGGEDGNGDAGESFIDKYNRLSDEDKKAVEHYAESLYARDESNAGEMTEPAEAPAPDQGQGIMMEITKGRLKKVQQRLNETFRGQEDERENSRAQKKVHAKGGKKSPFSSPFIN